MSETCSHNCDSCSSGATCVQREQTSFLESPLPDSHIRKVIGVVSGKGGVGKSLVTSMLSVLARRRGQRSAILDADITGPSIPRIFGLKSRMTQNARGLCPVETETGIPVVSLNLLVENETDPVIWRGPVIAGVVKQFWTDVDWGDVDCMFVDMPPGTGDVPLTVFQSIPVSAIVIVASPQELVGMIVEKAVKMAEMMEIPVLGLVENMSYFQCPTCGSSHFIFGESHADAIASAHAIPYVARIPMDPALAAICDAGRIEDFQGNWLDTLASACLDA